MREIRLMGLWGINIHLTLSAADFTSQHIHVADTSTVLISAIVSGNWIQMIC